jgi:hypothetical protein
MKEFDVEVLMRISVQKWRLDVKTQKQAENYVRDYFDIRGTFPIVKDDEKQEMIDVRAKRSR